MKDYQKVQVIQIPNHFAVFPYRITVPIRTKNRIITALVFWRDLLERFREDALFLTVKEDTIFLPKASCARQAQRRKQRSLGIWVTSPYRQTSRRGFPVSAKCRASSLQFASLSAFQVITTLGAMFTAGVFRQVSRAAVSSAGRPKMLRYVNFGAAVSFKQFTLYSRTVQPGYKAHGLSEKNWS